MDIKQERSLKMFGFSVEEIKNIKKVPRVTLYNRSGFPLENLPADTYHMEKYLRRGFTIKPPLQPESVTVISETVTEPKGNPVGFPCEACGKVLSTKLALAGHKRSHKEKVEV